jgi:hypothetical protein
MWSFTTISPSPRHDPVRSTIRRTGRDDTPSIPVSNSTHPARPPHPVMAHAGDDLANGQRVLRRPGAPNTLRKIEMPRKHWLVEP